VAEYDERSNLIAQTFVGLDGEPVVSANGYASWRSSYDEHGRAIPTALPASPCSTRTVITAPVTAYDERGNQIAQIFIGLDGKPLP
jgi:eukaryotic-like serine/threonine-protein kinase